MSDPKFFGAGQNIIPQSNFTATANDTGFFTATQDFKVRRDYLNSFAGRQKLKPGTSATSLDPDLESYWSFLTVSGPPDFRNEDGGWTVITVKYTGFADFQYELDEDEGSEPTLYSINGSLEEISIALHPSVASLDAAERAAISDLLDGRIEWSVADSKIVFRDQETGKITEWAESQVITSELGVAFADLIAKGTTTYKSPSITWTKTWTSPSPISATSLNDLGKVATPGGSPPTPTGGRNWMLISADSRQGGSEDPVYQNQLTWLLSPRGGWGSTLY